MWGKGTSEKSLTKSFYPLKPFKLKKHEWLVNSKISTGPYNRAWTICGVMNVSVYWNDDSTSIVFFYLVF